MRPNDLRSRREKLLLTQAELAERLGVHRTTVNRWEQGALTIERPVTLRVMLDSIEHELANDPAWRDEHNRRMEVSMRRRMADAEANPSHARDLAEWWRLPAETRGDMP